jgi:hypothetical protein
LNGFGQLQIHKKDINTISITKAGKKANKVLRKVIEFLLDSLDGSIFSGFMKVSPSKNLTLS